MEILKVKKKRTSEAQTIDKPENYYYQGIGWLLGTVSETEEGFSQITLLDGNSFGLKTPPSFLKILKKQTEDSPITPLWLQCYPNFNLHEQVLSFKGVFCRKERPSGVEPGIFLLRGVWHFIKFNRAPVFSIYRNQLKFPRDKVRNNHLPLIGLDETPFNQEKDAPNQKKFYQIEARLNSSLGCFEWIRNLAEPFHPPPPKLEKTAKFPNWSTARQTDEQKSSVEVEKSTDHLQNTLVEEENELHPQRLSREQMSKLMRISLWKLSQLIKEASNQTDPPIISHEGKQWRYIPNPEGRGKVFELVGN